MPTQTADLLASLCGAVPTAQARDMRRLFSTGQDIEFRAGSG
jgi:hypothetical protein